MRKQTVLLTAWLAAPIVLIVGLTVWVIVSMRAGSPMGMAPGVGAGAQDTGGANAIGEIMAKGFGDYLDDQMREAQEGEAAEAEGRVAAHTLGRGLRVVAFDASGTAHGGRPLRVSWQGSEWVEMFQTQEGGWSAAIGAERIEVGEPLLLSFSVLEDGQTLVELAGEGVAAEPHAAPLVDPAGMGAGEVPLGRYELWGFGLAE